MLRTLKLVLLLGFFLAGYYVGHLPGSPDIFGKAKGAYDALSAESAQIAERAKSEETTWFAATVSHVLDGVSRPAEVK